MVAGLAGIGAEIEATADGFVVTGAGRLRGGVLDAGGDHRLAMLGAIAGLASAEGVEVRGFDAAGVSYPGFARDLGSLLRTRLAGETVARRGQSSSGLGARMPDPGPG